MADYLFERVNNKALGELLVEKQIITRNQLEEALAFAHQNGLRLGEALKQLAFVTNDNISFALGEQFGITPVMVTSDMIDRDLLNRFPPELLRNHMMIPFVEVGDEIVVLISDPQDVDGLMQLGTYTPTKRITPQLGDIEQIRTCIDCLLPQPTSAETHQRQQTSTRPIQPCNLIGPVPEPGQPNFINWLLAMTLQNPAEDIIIRADNRMTNIYVNVPPNIRPEDMQMSDNKYEFSASLFPLLLDEISHHCVKLDPLNQDIFRWRAPLKFANKHFTLELSISNDLTGAVLRMRPLLLLDKNDLDPNAVIPKKRRLTCAIFNSLAAMQNFIFKIVNSAPQPPLILNSISRAVMRGTNCYPAGLARPSELALYFNAKTIVLDYPICKDELAQIQMVMPVTPDIYTCILTKSFAPFGISKDVTDLLNIGKYLTILDCLGENPTGKEIDKIAALSILEQEGAR